MSTLLAIETSVPQASVALMHDGVVEELYFESQRQQNQLLFEPLSQLLDKVEKIDTILVGTGPGSYSGSRIAIAAAHGLAAVHQAELAGICSFFAIPDLETNTTAVGDARRGSYFYYSIDEKDLSPAPVLVDKESFIEKFSSDKRSENLVTFEQQNALPLDGVELVTPKASELIRYWLRLTEQEQKDLSAKPLEPLYLRAPFITKSTKSHPLLGK